MFGGRIPGRTALLIGLAVLTGFAYGYLCAEAHLPPYPFMQRAYLRSKESGTLRRLVYLFRRRSAGTPLQGSWQPLSDALWCGDGTAADQDLTEFSGVGYLAGYRPAGKISGVTDYIRGCACDGVNLVTSGHGQEAVLIDMEGRVLHRWSYNFSDAFPGAGGPSSRVEVNVFSTDFWRRTHLYPNGDLLAIYDGFGIIKLDYRSNLIWAVDGGCHHDMYVDDDGFIFVLTRSAATRRRYNDSGEVLEGSITILDPDGTVLRRVSLLDAFERSSYAALLERRPSGKPDILHTNTVQVLDGSHESRSPVFARGNVLISSRSLDTIAIVDMDAERVVWALTGQWLAQHEPTLLRGGSILLLDNRGHFGMSKVIEIDPLSQEILWAYEGTPENCFYTETSGTVHRLPNGNTLIVESNGGRAFEVATDGEIAWQYYSPQRAGENSELVATLFDVIRLPVDYVRVWLPAEALSCYQSMANTR
jgi:hypothetical protein